METRYFLLIIVLISFISTYSCWFFFFKNPHLKRKNWSQYKKGKMLEFEWINSGGKANEKLIKGVNLIYSISKFLLLVSLIALVYFNIERI